jgi:hypothetical protein
MTAAQVTGGRRLSHDEANHGDKTILHHDEAI